MSVPVHPHEEVCGGFSGSHYHIYLSFFTRDKSKWRLLFSDFNWILLSLMATCSQKKEESSTSKTVALCWHAPPFRRATFGIERDFFFTCRGARLRISAVSKSPHKAWHLPQLTIMVLQLAPFFLAEELGDHLSLSCHKNAS